MTNTQRTAKHTPGPWKWSQESVDPEWAIVTSEGGNIVANVNSETGPDIPPLVSTKMPQHANAALIAAAPELLAIIKDMRQAFYVKGTRKALLEVMERSKDLIAKAEGRQS